MVFTQGGDPRARSGCGPRKETDARVAEPSTGQAERTAWAAGRATDSAASRNSSRSVGRQQRKRKTDDRLRKTADGGKAARWRYTSNLRWSRRPEDGRPGVRELVYAIRKAAGTRSAFEGGRNTPPHGMPQPGTGVLEGRSPLSPPLQKKHVTRKK